MGGYRPWSARFRSTALPRRRDPSDLTDAQWAVLAPLIPAPKPGGRPAQHDRREIVEAILSVLRGGIAWRALPHDYPPWEQCTTVLRERVRVRASRPAHPRGAILDSQSAKTTEKGGAAAMTAPKK